MRPRRLMPRRAQYQDSAYRADNSSHQNIHGDRPVQGSQPARSMSLRKPARSDDDSDQHARGERTSSCYPAAPSALRSKEPTELERIARLSSSCASVVAPASR
jgi:hypothetical protein